MRFARLSLSIILLLLIMGLFSIVVLADLATDNSVPGFVGSSGVVFCHSVDRCAYWVNGSCGSSACFPVDFFDRRVDTVKNCEFTNSFGDEITRCDKVDECVVDADCVGVVSQCPRAINVHCNDSLVSGFKYCECNNVNYADDVQGGETGDTTTETQTTTNTDCPWRSVIENKKERISGRFYYDGEGKVYQLPIIFYRDNNNEINNMKRFLLKQFYGTVFTLHRIPELDGIVGGASRNLYLFDDGNVYFGSLKYNGTYNDGALKFKFNKGSKIGFFSNVKQVISNDYTYFRLPKGLICALSNNGDVSCISSYLARLNGQYKLVLLDSIDISLSNIKKIIPFNHYFVQNFQLDAEGRNTGLSNYYMDGFDALGYDGVVRRVILNKTVTWNGDNYDVQTNIVNISIIPINDIFDISTGDNGRMFLLINNSVKLVDYNFKKSNYQISTDNDGFVIGYDNVARTTGFISQSSSPVITCDGHLKYSGDIGRGSYSTSGHSVYYSNIVILSKAIFVGIPPLENITSINTGSIHYALSFDNDIYVWGGFPYYNVITSPLKINYVLEGDVS